MPNLVDQPTASPTRKVWAMIWVLLGAVALLVALLIVKALWLPDVAVLDTIVGTLASGLIVPLIGIIAAYLTREAEPDDDDGDSLHPHP